jgi:hypothetical protein
VHWEQEVILWLWRVSTGLEVVLCIRLAVSGLWRSYPYFFAYIAALATESTILIPLDQSKDLYYKVWVVTRTILLAVETAAVLEIFNRWSDSFQGIGKFGKQLLLVLLALATGICLSTLPINWSTRGWVFAIYLMLVVNRAVQAGLAAFLILMLGFYTKFGGPVARNLKRHTWAMTAFVVANALGYFLLTSKKVSGGQYAMQAVSAGTLIFWIATLRSSGEVPPETPQNPDAWAEAEAMNRQLMEFASSVKQKQTRRAAGKK